MSTFEILITSVQHILSVETDEHFEQIVKELPNMLIALRKSAAITWRYALQWPVSWQPDGQSNRINVHCTDGVVTIEVPAQQKP